jgi:hypothetical protein
VAGSCGCLSRRVKARTTPHYASFPYYRGLMRAALDIARSLLFDFVFESFNMRSSKALWSLGFATYDFMTCEFVGTTEECKRQDMQMYYWW